MSEGFHHDSTVPVCVWPSVESTSPHMTRALKPGHVIDYLCPLASISLHDIILPLMIAQVFHGLPGPTRKLHHFCCLAFKLFALC